jgi:hypothetical protein
MSMLTADSQDQLKQHRSEMARRLLLESMRVAPCLLISHFEFRHKLHKEE